LIKVENKKKYKLILKTFLNNKSNKILKLLKLLNTKLEIELPLNKLTFYNDLYNAIKDKIKE
jgi:hypothetical protein